MAAVAFRYLVQLHKDVQKAARFYSEGLGFTISVCTLHSPVGGAQFRPAQALSLAVSEVGIWFTESKKRFLLTFKTLKDPFWKWVADINSTVTKVMALGEELDGPIKYEIHGKVSTNPFEVKEKKTQDRLDLLKW